jgi:hypothetical protein
MPTDSHLTLVPVLIDGFPRWVEYFQQHVPFSKPDQLAFHRQTIDLRMSHGSASAALRDPAFVESLYQTLKAWGIGSRHSRLRSLPDVTLALQAAAPQVAALEGFRIDANGMEVDAVADAVWTAIETLPSELT